MANQTKLLKVVADRGGWCSLDTICQDFRPGAPFGAKTKLRKEVINALGKLLQKELVERRAQPRVTFGGNAAVEYRATAAGRDLVKAGKPIVGKKTGPRNCLPKPKGEMRQRLWEAMRLAKKATVQEIVEVVRQDGDAPAVKVIKDCRNYFTALASAGVLTRLAVRAQGSAPTSNGFIRYALVRDLGPIAPSAGARCVTDHNVRHGDDTTAQARIPYAQKESA